MKKMKLSYLLTVLLAIGSGLSALATYLVIVGEGGNFGPDPDKVLGLMMLNLTLLVGLLVLVVRRVLKLWRDVKHGAAGSRLLIRIVVIFSLVTLIPAAAVTAFSVTFFDLGIKSWFDRRVSIALEDSLEVARAYLAEHQEIIKADALALASDLNRESYLLYDNPALLNKFIAGQSQIRGMPEIMVFTKDRTLAKTSLSFSLAFERMPPNAVQQASEGEVVVLTSDEEDKVRALVKVESMGDVYLMVGRYVDPKVINYMENTQGAVDDYVRLKNQIASLQHKLFFVFIAVAALLLLTVVWYGMSFAIDLVKPLGRLIAAAEKVKGGDLSVKLDEKPGSGEIETLTKTFNSMTEQLNKQRQEVVSANLELDARRRFIEAVLAGVSAGVIAVNPKGEITLVNDSACKMLGKDSVSLHGQPLANVFPELSELLREAKAGKANVSGRPLVLGAEGKQVNLQVKVSQDVIGDSTLAGHIITFDDMTSLIVAERTAAWADVARRVAHEIKNPLTPIQLATERLKKKYMPEAEAEKENFAKYIDTIARHIGDIGRMVEEFVSFARMPAARMEGQDICEMIKKVVISESIAHPDMQYSQDMPESGLIVNCDGRLMSQALSNLLKNAAEALTENQAEGVEKRIGIVVSRESEMCVITVSDNGKGFPKELMSRLTEPYVTTRVKGTGLGLAIVKRIVEEHKGEMKLDNLPEGGAKVEITLPL